MATSQSTTIATRRPRLVRTESQKKRSAAKAAETRARNKAAKATHNSNSMDAVRPDDASESAINPPPPGPQIPQVPPGSTLSGNVDDGFESQIDPNLRALQAPSTQAPSIPTPSTEQGHLSPAHRTCLSTPTQHQRSLSPTSEPNGNDLGPSAGPSSLTTPPLAGPSSLTTPPLAGPSSMTTPPLAGPSSMTTPYLAGPPSLTMTTTRSTPLVGPSRTVTSRCAREKKLVAYRTYNPKDVLGLAGHEHKERWQLLREIVRGLLKAQRFQAALSWTKHSLTQRAVVVTETQKELAKKVASDPEWSRVISQPLLSQVIEDIAKDCCNNVNSYKSKKRKGYGTG